MKRCKAFTLIEIMIALVIYSMLMGAITNAIHLTKKLNEQDERTGDQHLERYLTLLVIGEDCRNFVEPRKGSSEPKFERDVLDDMQTIKFYSVVQRPITARGIYRIIYKVENKQLVRELKQEPAADGTGGDETISKLTFLDNVKSLSFRFGDSPDALEPDWKHANRVPRYIGFEITFGDDDRITESVSWKFSLGQVS